MDLQSWSVVNRVARGMAPVASRVCGLPPLSTLVALGEAYLAIVRGKGAGSGWAMAAEVAAARRVVQEAEPVVLDVGAHRGAWSVAFRRLLPGSRMFLVEPQLECAEALEALRDSRTWVVKAAVSSEPGTRRLFKGAEVSEKASLHPRGDSFLEGVEMETVEVLVTTIDALLEEHGIARVDFMKMDLEGHELEALRGAVQALEAGSIRALQFEFGGANINSRTFFRDFWSLLDGYGYRIARILPHGGLLPIERYGEDCEHFRGVSNYVAWLSSA